jgi:hypothetical protein
MMVEAFEGNQTETKTIIPLNHNTDDPNEGHG